MANQLDTENSVQFRHRANKCDKLDLPVASVNIVLVVLL